MTEHLSNSLTITSTKMLPVNPEAHTSLQLLHRHSSDEDDGDNDDEEEEEEETEDDDEHKEKEVENNGDIRINEPKNDQFVHSISAPIFASSPTSSVSIGRGRGRGRGSRLMCTASPGLLPVSVEQSSSPVLRQTQSEISSPQSLDETHEYPVTTIHTTQNHHYSHPIEAQPLSDTIDFSLNASTTKIIFDDISGYNKALIFLKNHQISNQPTRNYADIWAFCLKSRTTRFYHLEQFRSEILNSSKEFSTPQACISPCKLPHTDSQFWLAFERRPTFNDEYFNPDTHSMETPTIPMTNNSIIDRIRYYSNVDMILSYGALTSMNEYYYHPEYNFSKRSDWTIVFRLKKIEIERSEERRTNDGMRKNERSTLPADLIDRVAVFTVTPIGFSVYICIKGNLHESTRVYSSASNSSQTERTSKNDIDCPIFSTICIRIFAKTNTKNHYNESDKYSALCSVRRSFKNFLDFFYANQIAVCFASIKPDRGCFSNRPSLSVKFTTPIQIYAFTMLRNVGYAVEQKLFQHRSISETLLGLAHNDDDIVYRLCLFLFRRSSEYHFLNLEQELYVADREYRTQLEQCNILNEEMATILSPPRENYAYVPSIRITPTTIQLLPLRLVKRHRVHREKNFKDPMSLALVEMRDEANRPLYTRDFRSLRKKFEQILINGIEVNRIYYRYLHHSMSQVKEKQFWFLNCRYPIEDVLAWMGNFDNERVVAKHAARIAQCFTSTEPSIRIPAEHVQYIADIETPDKKYCFTDGVGRLSQEYFKKLQLATGRRFLFSVVQIRYGGCKGTLSIDPSLDNQPKQLIIRESMRKFNTDHDRLEICKVSSPRPLYLNRQDILLLSGRNIPDSYFLVLQNENHLWLVQALLCSSVAFELLNERVGSSCFHFRDIATTFNLVEEPFFLQLLITSGHDCVSKFQQRAKIRIPKNQARNMFGIVDECGVLEPGEVFIQYSHLNDEKLDITDKPSTLPPTILNNVKVAITKNPCHHPGDLRTFTAVDRPELRHLVDVVVFPQKGSRPHPNEISGSDLDGDEYAVIWYRDLVPTTTNDDAYDYDSQEKPIKLSRSVERKDIINIVLDIAEQNLTGDMSNLHLAMADSLGTRHPDVIHLAGLTSQELDAPKTGKHPISSEELHRDYRIKHLEERYPDFMMRERYKSYVSGKIIGQLYRSARRAIIRWHKAARNHCSSRHLHAAQLEDDASHDEDIGTLINQSGSSSLQFKQRQSFDHTTSNLHEPSLALDPTIQHPQSRNQERWARSLFSFYRETLRNIISVFNYQDEIDLFCRCETLDQLASGKQDLNISAGLELQRLIDTTRRQFFYDFDQLRIDSNSKPVHSGPCTRDRSCEPCVDIKLARAAACYYVCYSQAAKLSTKARSRILSFPWLFGSLLAKLKERNQASNSQMIKSKYIVIGRAMRNIAKRLLEKQELKLKICWRVYSETACLYLRALKSTKSNDSQHIRRRIIEYDHPTKEMNLTKVLLIEILNNWIRRQNIFGEHSAPEDKKPLIREICWHQLLIEFISMIDEDLPEETDHFEEYKLVFQTTNNLVMTERYIEYIKNQISNPSMDFDQIMYNYCIALIRLCFRISREHQSNEYAYLSDYLILALQAIGIEKELNDLSIDVDT